MKLHNHPNCLHEIKQRIWKEQKRKDKERKRKGSEGKMDILHITMKKLDMQIVKLLMSLCNRSETQCLLACLVYHSGCGSKKSYPKESPEFSTLFLQSSFPCIVFISHPSQCSD